MVNKVTSAIEGFRFNTAIAFLMEFSHKLILQGVNKKVLSTYILLLSPFAPHISEEIWSILGNKKSIQTAAWPEVKETKEEKEVNLPVQVNGKVRDVIKISPGAEQNEAVEKALKSEKVKARVGDSSKAKIIYVKGRILNFVLTK